LCTFGKCDKRGLGWEDEESTNGSRDGGEEVPEMEENYGKNRLSGRRFSTGLQGREDKKEKSFLVRPGSGGFRKKDDVTVIVGFGELGGNLMISTGLKGRGKKEKHI